VAHPVADQARETIEALTSLLVAYADDLPIVLHAEQCRQDRLDLVSEVT